MTLPSTPEVRRRLLTVAVVVAVVSASFAGPAIVAAAQVHAVSISPTTATAGVATSFTVTVDNLSTAPGQTQLGCVRVAIPAGVTVSGTPAVVALDPPLTPGTPRSWSAPAVVTGALQTIRTGAANPNDIDTGGRVQVTFTATIAAAGTTVFTTTAFGQTNCSGQAFTLSGSQPSVTVTAANAAPVLNVAGSPSLSSILEDPAGNAGDSVPSLIGSGGGSYITDADAGAVQGLAITSADTANGAWEYSTNGGGSWASVGAVSTASARLLGSSAANRLRFVPNANYHGSATVTFRAWDQTTGTNGSTADTTTNGGTSAFSTATDTASIAVQAVNDAPSFAAGANQTVGEDAGPQTVAGWATSISAGPANESSQSVAFSFTNNTNPGLFAGGPSIDASGTLTYTPAANASGVATLTVVLVDNGGTIPAGQDTSAPQAFTITVTAANDAPSCADDGASTAEDTPLNGSVSCTDVDGDGLTYSEVVGPSDGSLTLNPDGSFTYDPDPDFNGTDSFTFVGNDGLVDSNVATFTVTVTAANDAPTCVDDGGTTAEDTPLNGTLFTCSDVDGDGLTYGEVVGPSNGNLTVNPDGSFTYGPDPDFNGTDSFTFVANDGTTDSNVATFSVGVGVGNDAPVLDPIGNKVVDEGSTLTFTATASDIDLPADTLTFSLAGAPGTAIIDSVTGEFSWTPLVDGPVTFDVCVDDGSEYDCETITVTVLNVTPSVALAGPSSATAGETHTYSYTMVDPGLDSITLTESCGANATWIDTPAPFSFACHFTNGPTTTMVSVTADDGDPIDGTGGDSIVVAVAGVPPTATPTPTGTPAATPTSAANAAPGTGGSTAPSSTPAPGTGQLPNTAMSPPLAVTVLTWIVLAAVVSYAAIAFGARGATSQAAPASTADRRRTGGRGGSRPTR